MSKTFISATPPVINADGSTGAQGSVLSTREVTHDRGQSARVGDPA